MNYSRFVERSEFMSTKNGSAIDRKPSAGHYCAGLLSGDLQVTSIGSAWPGIDNDRSFYVN